MTKKEIIKKLESLRGMRKRLLSMKIYKEEEREIYTGLKATQYDKIAVKSSKGNSVEENTHRYLEAAQKVEERYNTLLDEYIAIEDEIAEKMRCLNPTEYEVILNYYMMSGKKTAREIGDIMGLSEDRVKHIAMEARKKMYEN